MVVKPMRWAPVTWQRFEERALAAGVAVSEVVRQCAIAGLSFIEAQEAMQSHVRKPA